jgi:integrase
MALAAATGTVTLQTSAVPSQLPVPPGANAQRLQPLLATAALLTLCVPPTSQAKIDGAVGRFREALTFWSLTAPCEQAVLAYVVARCCPPVGFEVPPSCGQPVLPQTVAGDVDALRRAARLNMHDMRPHSDALYSTGVSELLRAIGGRMKRLKTCKRALLFAEVERNWERAEKSGDAIAIRDAFAVTVAFFFGMRVSELLTLTPDDITAVELPSDDSCAMQITFRHTKNRQSLLKSHDPFVVTCGHPLLMRAWDAFEAVTDYFDGVPVFHALRGSTRDPLSRRWFSEVIKAIAPAAVPHSARVGLATEMWAAGASVQDIMTAGRWTSATAVMYVIGSLEGQVQATRKIGGGLVYSGGDLRRLGVSPDRMRPDQRPKASAMTWARIASQVESD